MANETLSLILESVGADKLVANLESAAKGSEDAGLAEQRRAAATLTAAAADDKAALALAKLNLEKARQAGGGGLGSDEQVAVQAATDKSRLSALEAAAAQRSYKADTLAAAAAAETAATEQTGLAGALSKVGLSGALATPAVLQMGVAIAGLAVLDIIKSGIQNFLELTNQVRQFSQVTGASAEESSLFVGQMNALGVDTGAADKAFLRFGASLGDGTDKLSKFGIQVAHTKDGQVDLIGTLENVRSAYQGASDAATKDAIAKQLSLRGATELLPILNATNAQINQINAATRARGDIFSQQDLNDARNLQVAEQELSAAFKGLEIELARGVVPAATQAVSELTKIVNLANKVGSIKIGGQSILSGLESAFSGATNALGLFGNKSDEAAQKQLKLNDALAQAAQAADREKQSVDTLQSSLEADVSAQEGLQSAQQGVTDAVKAHNDALAAQQTLVSGGLAGYSDYISAEQGLASAKRSAASATEAEKQAQDDLAKALQGATKLELAQAQNKVDLATDKISSAKLAVQDAQTKLDALLGSGSASAEEIANAQQAVKDATDRVTQAQLDQQQAQLDLTTTKQKGTQQDQAVMDAEKRVADAHQNVVDANQRVKDATDRVSQAQANYAKAVAAAQDQVDKTAADIQRKQMDVESATLHASDAAQKLLDTIGNTDSSAYDTLKSKLDQLAPSYAAALKDAQALQQFSSALPSSTSSSSTHGGFFGSLLNSTTSGGTGGFFGGLISASAGSTVNNINVYAQTNASAADIANEIAWSLNALPTGTTRRT